MLIVRKILRVGEVYTFILALNNVLNWKKIPDEKLSFICVGPTSCKHQKLTRVSCLCSKRKMKNSVVTRIYACKLNINKLKYITIIYVHK